MIVQKAKYELIADWLREQVECGEIEADDKIPSENELTARFNVSRQTVRHAISVLEKKGMLISRRGSGTYVCSTGSQKRKQTMRIAVITTYVDEYIFPVIIKEIERTLGNAGYSMQMAFTHNAVERERVVLEGLLRDDQVDGIIVEAAKSGLPSPNLELYRALQKKGIPLLFLNSYYPGLTVPHVSLDDRQAGKLVTNHLLQCGHKNIAAVFKVDDGQGHQRYSGYVEALMAAEIKIRDSQVIWVDTEDIHKFSDITSRILKRLKGCTACVCYNDEVANKLVGICLEEGIRIPEDLSIISIDNSDLAAFCEVPLTSATNPLVKLGTGAAEMIIRMAEGDESTGNMNLEPELEIRHSVKILG